MSVAQKDAEFSQYSLLEDTGERTFPLINSYDILEGEKEALEEKLELLLERNMAIEMNMKNSDVTALALKEDIEKRLSVSDNLSSNLVKLNQQINRLNFEKRGLGRDAVVERKKHTKGVKRIAKQQKNFQSLLQHVKQLKDLKQNEIEKSRDKDHVIEEKTNKIRILEFELAKLRAEKHNRDFKSQQVQKYNQEAFETTKEIMKLLDLKPSGQEDRPRSSTCKSTNVAHVDKTDLENIKLHVLQLLRDNKRMAFDEGVLKTEIDRSRAILKECHEGVRRERRRTNPFLACFRR